MTDIFSSSIFDTLLRSRCCKHRNAGHRILLGQPVHDLWKGVFWVWSFFILTYFCYTFFKSQSYLSVSSKIWFSSSRMLWNPSESVLNMHCCSFSIFSTDCFSKIGTIRVSKHLNTFHFVHFKSFDPNTCGLLALRYAPIVVALNVFENFISNIYQFLTPFTILINFPL